MHKFPYYASMIHEKFVARCFMYDRLRPYAFVKMSLFLLEFMISNEKSYEL